MTKKSNNYYIKFDEQLDTINNLDRVKDKQNRAKVIMRR